MKVLVLGTIPNDSFLEIKNVSFVEKPEEADFVILSDSLKSYFLGTQLGEIIERSHNLEFTRSKPKVISLKDFFEKFQNSAEVSL